MEAFPYRVPLKIPYAWAKGVQVERRGLHIRYRDAWGEVAPPPHAVPRDEEMLAEFTRVTKGLDPDADDFIAAIDDRNPNSRIRCGISSAWHLARKTDFGPRSEHVPVNGLVTGAEIELQVEELLERGITTFKLKIDGASDVDRVARLRAAAGGDAVIRLDANESLGSQALEYLKKVSRYRIEYIEQPLPACEVDGLCRLQRDSGIAIALDEAATDAKSIAELLDIGAGSVVIIKPQRLGGPDRSISAMRIALERGAKVVVTNSLETNVGLDLARFVASHLPEPIPPCGLDTGRYLASTCRAAL